MRRLYIAPITVALLTACLPLRAHAQSPPPSGEGLTLEQAIDRGLAASHRLGELQARVAGTEAALHGAEAVQQPQVSAIAGYTRTNHIEPFGIPAVGGVTRVIYPDVPDNYRTRLDFQWAVFTFGRTGAAARAARAENKASGLDLAAGKNDLRLEIARAYWATVTAGEAVKVLTESVRRMDATLEDVRNRLKVGLVPPNDVLSVEAQRSRQEVLLIQAKNLREQALADLCRLIGAAPGTPLVLAAQLEKRLGPTPPTDQLVAEARQTRPDRQALEARVASAGERREAAAAGGRPVISAAGGMDLARPNPRIFPRLEAWKQSWDAGINFNWTFKDGGKVAADVALQTAAERAAKERLAEFDSQLEVEVLQRRLDVDAAGGAIAAANDSVRAATEARRVVGERYAAGVATTTDILDAQVALLQAGLDLAQAQANARLAEARLARAIGR
jgi:outer membrane protein